MFTDSNAQHGQPPPPADDPGAVTGPAALSYEFGPFRVEVGSRSLLREGRPVEMKRKTFELLVTLLARRGEVVHKDDLMGTLWPDTIVEEANLTQNIYLLRKALGESAEHPIYVQTVPKHGYRFIAEVKVVREAAPHASPVTRGHAGGVGQPPAAAPAPASAPTRRARPRIALAALLAAALGAALYTFLSGRGADSGVAPSGAGLMVALDRDAQARRGTRVHAAYEAYAQGAHHRRDVTEPSVRRAIECFEEAVRLDPNYALAHAALADSYSLVGYLRYGLMPRDEAYRRARAGALHALKLDENVVEARLTLGSIKNDYDGDSDGAEREFKRAIEMSPNHASARSRYSTLLLAQGRFSESYEQVREAYRLSPLTPGINVHMIVALLQMRDYEKAERHCAKAAEIASDDPYLIVYCGIAVEQKGRVEEALGRYRVALGLTPEGSEPHSLALQFYGLACAATGRVAEAREAARRLAPVAEYSDEKLVGLAGIYARLGETETALGYLDRVMRNSPGQAYMLQGDPRISILEGDPRYAALLKKYAAGPAK